MSATQLTSSVIDQPIAPVSRTVDPPSVDPVITRNLQSSKVPSSRIGRLFHYGGMSNMYSCGTILVYF